ncbi:MAG: divergent polysaccharide deacetylase family protein [Candidatus Omnitrophota bacterium]
MKHEYRNKNDHPINVKRILLYCIIGAFLGAAALVCRQYAVGVGRHPVPAQAKAAVAAPNHHFFSGQSRSAAKKQTSAAATVTSFYPPPKPGHGRVQIAIVLDDFGNSYQNIEAVMNINRPMTFSILPHLPYSKKISERVHRRGFEAILHLPMEAHKEDRPVRSEPGTITTAMNQDEIISRMESALACTPYVEGVSNHQGSKATESEAVMRPLLLALKKKGLFFFDSFSSGKSVGAKVARETGIRFARRDVFLDNNEDFKAIKAEMDILVKRAKKNGYAIGIGHDRKRTVAALALLVMEAEKEGVEFVPLSRLIR